MPNYPDIEPGIKIAAQMSPESTPADLDFVRQMGVEYAVLWTGGDKASYEYYASRRALFSACVLIGVGALIWLVVGVRDPRATEVQLAVVS